MRPARRRVATKALWIVCSGLVWAGLPRVSWAVEPTAAAGTATGSAARRFYTGPGLKAFLKGYRSWELGDWEATVRGMEEALAADGDHPEAQVRPRAVWFVPYIPSYYLLLARCKLDECGEAEKDHQKVLNLIKDARDDIRSRFRSDCHEGCRLGSGEAPE